MNGACLVGPLAGPGLACTGQSCHTRGLTHSACVTDFRRTLSSPVRPYDSPFAPSFQRDPDSDFCSTEGVHSTRPVAQKGTTGHRSQA